MHLVERLLKGEVRALARAISLVEAQTDGSVGILQALYPRTGRAAVIGLTGAPGSGKSSLVDRLVGVYRAAGHRVGVVAVDPSSSFSGGAILGDRIRMQEHATDPDVFIRSMATRGQLGGLARATNDVIDLLDAAGYDPILVETVGVGQDEVDVVRTADAVAVVLVPGMGDDVQAIKAGILEIGDVFVINKADRDGVERLQADLEYMLSLTPPCGVARPTIHRTVAVRGEGIVELRAGIEAVLAARDEGRRGQRRRDRAEVRLRALLEEKLVAKVLEVVLPGDEYLELVGRVADRSVDPYTALQKILERVEVR